MQKPGLREVDLEPSRGVVVSQLHSKKLKLGFCAGSNAASGIMEIRDDDSGPGWK